MTDIQTTSLLLQLFYQCFYNYHYRHRYHYPYHHFIINILCYVPSVITCIVGGAIQLTVYDYHYDIVSHLCDTHEISYERLLDGGFHDLSPVIVDHLEHLSLLRHLLHDVLRREDWVEVEPLSLNLQPLVNCLLDANHSLFPLANLFLKRFDKRRPVIIYNKITWNALPNYMYVRLSDSLAIFKSRLKTALFTTAFDS